MPLCEASAKVALEKKCNGVAAKNSLVMLKGKTMAQMLTTNMKGEH